MPVYILQVPHQLPPKAWEAETEQDAIWLLSEQYGCEFDDLSEAVAYDMSSGYWAESPEALKESATSLRHQYFAAMGAIDRAF